MYSITRYTPSTALKMNPINPSAGMPHNLGPVSESIASEDPINNADTINETDNWFVNSLRS